MNGVSLPIGYVPCHLLFPAYLMVVFLDQSFMSLAHWLMFTINQNNSMVWSPLSAFWTPTELYAALNGVHVDVAKKMKDILNNRCVKVTSGLIFHTYIA